MGIENLPLVRTLEADGKLGTPVMGWGSYPTMIEAAKIGLLLTDEGVWAGQTLLDKNKVHEALERSSRRGMETNTNAVGNHPTRYLHSFWLPDIALSVGTITAPTMNGLGGNFVVLCPGGTIAIRFSDQNVVDVGPMVAVAEFCRRYQSR